MPGLFGILDLTHKSISEEVQKTAFKNMGSTLRHHDEDLFEQSYISRSNLLIGRVGLSGQNPVSWPMQGESGESGVRTFVSGPVFEHGLDKSLNGIPDINMLGRWNGFYSAVLADPVHGRTLFIVDRRASCPIFYAQTEHHLLFAPEVKALIASLLVKKEIDLEAVGTFLAQGYLLGDQTLFKSVRRLRGGEALRVENGRVVKESYWRFAPGSVPSGATQAELQLELGELLNAAARKHMGKPEKTVIFLSGGVDSRAILGGALEVVEGHGEKLHTVSWGASMGSADSDVAVSALIARHLQTNHRFTQRKIEDYREHFARVNCLIDGLSDMAGFYPYEYQIMVNLRHLGYERVLRGDEVFGWSFPASTNEGAFALANLRRLRDVKGLAGVVQGTYYDELCQASDAAVDAALFEARDLSPNQAKDFFYFTHRLQCYLQTASYYKQVELDQRNVLLDDALLDFMEKVPDPMRIDKTLFRQVVLQEYPRLAQFPYSKRSNTENWLKLLATESPVREYVLAELDDRSSGIWQFLDPNGLQKIMESRGKMQRVHSVLRRIRPKSLIKQGLAFLTPGLLAKTSAQRRARPAITLRADMVIMRSLVLKNWYDTFVR